MAHTAKIHYVCNNCGQEYVKWQGKCHNCGQWESIVEFRIPAGHSSSSRSKISAPATAPVKISSCSSMTSVRMQSGFADLDRVLGGGFVAGGVVLLGGDPGIGKSTILLQTAANLANAGKKVLYISGEESAEQVSLRAERLGVKDSQVDILTETSMESILSAMATAKPSAVIIDSIQTMAVEGLESAPGSVSQVRESAAMLCRFAKENGCVVILVGHMTKEGAIAGPRVLEHMVDTVLYFEGDESLQYRILRTSKNRFGPSGEIALYAMHDGGLKEVRDSTGFFMRNRDEPQVGSAFVPVREGTRVIVVELQALVNRTHFGIPQRVASGINPKKIALSLAVLERYGSIGLGDYDIFFNVAGGLAIAEPAADLGIAAAVLSSFRNRPISKGMAFIGEVGLGGEVRAINNMGARLRELASMGFTRCVLPAVSNSADWNVEKKRIEFIPLKHIQNIAEFLFE